MAITVVCILLAIAQIPEGIRGITLICYATTGLAIFGVVKRKYWWTALGVMIAGAIWLSSTSWTFNWRDRVRKNVAVTVLDTETGRPISGASVTLENGWSGSHVIQYTDENGETIIDWEFFASGKDFGIFRTGVLRIEWEGLRVEADGYETLLEKIYARTGFSFPLDQEIPEFEIGLASEKAKSALASPLLRAC